MNSKLCVVLLSLAMVVGFATSSSAQNRKYPVTGTLQYQIGNGLPIPIAVPAQAIGGARVSQPTAAADPKPLIFDGNAVMTHPGTPFNIALAFANPAVFQVNTGVTIAFPNAPATLSAGGRTGASVVAWCPGVPVTPVGTGGCASPSGGTIPGRIIYTSTGAQFGGVARGATGGFADVAVNVNGVPTQPATPMGSSLPCNFATNVNCQVRFALATPAGTAAAGGAFNAVVGTSGAAPPTGFFNASVGAIGTILYVTPTGLGPGLPNPATSFGAPWTTGMLTVNQPAANPPENFNLTGSDNRENGIGTISLVSGAISTRSLTGPNGNRGWLVLTIGGDTPALGTWGIGALAVVLAGVATRRLRKSA